MLPSRLRDVDERSEEHGLGRSSGPGIDGRIELTGVDTMAFSTEWLPLLRERPGVRVEVSGNPVD